MMIAKLVIAAGSNIYKDIVKPGVYGGNPVRKITDLEPEFILEKPESYIDYEFDIELLRKYLPNSSLTSVSPIASFIIDTCQRFKCLQSSNMMRCIFNICVSVIPA